jgi:repressor LexA
MTTTETISVTKRQVEILRWIANYINSHGFSPTIREGMKAFGFDSPNGFVCHLQPLARKGLLVWVEGCPRTLRLTPAGVALLEEVQP